MNYIKLSFLFPVFIFSIILFNGCHSDETPLPAEICNDGIDNDLDGFIDCADFDCDANSSCAVEICNDGIDNDQDGFIDCADFDCDANSNCAVEICNDGIDNDQDGFIDCADGDCVGDPAC